MTFQKTLVNTQHVTVFDRSSGFVTDLSSCCLLICWEMRNLAGMEFVKASKFAVKETGMNQAGNPPQSAVS